MRRSINYIAVLAAAVLASAGCAKQPGWHSGMAVRFGAGARAESLTKTSYGAYSGGTVQMINWEESDMVRIACAQAEGSVKTADYQTSAGTAEGTSSIATLSLASGSSSGLRWGSEGTTHTFYGVYPSPAVKSGDALTTGGQLTGNIPSVQTCELGNGSTNTGWTSSPDMKLQYMVAKKSVTESDYDSEAVFLNFTPITTAIEFEVTNAMTEALEVGSIEIISAGKNLSGTFTTSLETLSPDGGICPAVAHTTSPSDATGTVKVQFCTGSSTAKPVLSSNAKLTFTVFLLPESDLDDLTFRINKVGGGYLQTALKSSETSWYTFGKHKKHFIKGLLAKEGAKWTLSFDPDVDKWGNTDINQDLGDPDIGSLPDLISWDMGEQSDLNMRETPESKFTFDDGNVSKEHTFTGIPSTEGITFDIISTMGDAPQDWKIKSVGGVTVDGTSHTTADGDLAVEIVSGSLKITDTRQKVSNGDNKHWTNNSAGNVWYSQSWGNEEGGLNKGTIDLSKYDFENDFYSSTNPMRTANCYIIRHAGTYKIPLVYGNAIDYVKNTSTGKNAEAYNPDGVTSGTNVLKPFVNHLGYGIIDPYIENNTNDGQPKRYTAASGKEGHKDYKPESYNNYLSASSASVVWQDNGTVIPNVAITPATSPLERKTTDTDATSNTKYTASNVRYLQFTISQEDIRQCNAVIAVKDASNNIMWSLHIWITNDPAIGSSAITVNNGTQDYNFFPTTCLGWLEPQMYEEKPDVEVILEQEESGETISVTVSQELYDDFYSNGTYYQWGRKDPLPSAAITNYSIFNGQATLLKESILAPNKFYMFAGNWYSTDNYFNLWSGKVTTTGDMENSSSMVKTVYDPSPVGYKVPAPNAFSSLTTANSTGVFKKGMYFYTTSAKDNTIFFATCGYDSRSSGIKTSQGSAYYWSSINDDSDNKRGRRFYFSSSTEPNLGNNNKTEGFAIRPVTE